MKAKIRKEISALNIGNGLQYLSTVYHSGKCQYGGYITPYISIFYVNGTFKDADIKKIKGVCKKYGFTIDRSKFPEQHLVYEKEQSE